MKRLLLAAVVMSLLLFTGNVYATILTFEDLHPGYETITSLPGGYAGFTWNQDAWWITKYYHPGSGYDYGMIGNVAMFTAWGNDASMSNTTPFDFNGAYITAAWDATETATVEGWRGGSLIYSQLITTHNDAPYWFDFNFSNVNTVWFRPHGQQLAIDNITFDQGVPPIPEPASMFLFGSGLLGLLGFNRKRKQI